MRLGNLVHERSTLRELDVLLNAPFTFIDDDVLVASAIGSAYRAPLPGGSRWSSDYSPESRIFLSYCLHTLPQELASDGMRADIRELLSDLEAWHQAMPPSGEQRLPEGSPKQQELSCLEEVWFRSATKVKAYGPATVPAFFRNQMMHFIDQHEHHNTDLEDLRWLRSLHAFSSAACSIVHYLESPEFFED